MEKNTQKLFKYEAFSTEYTDNENVIIIKPYLYKIILSSPFVNENRISNIDFKYRLNNASFYSLEIPEGYSVDLPESINISSEDGTVKFKYAAIRVGNKVNITQKIVFKKGAFSPNDYFMIKSMFEKVAHINNQGIILTKE